MLPHKGSNDSGAIEMMRGISPLRGPNLAPAHGGLLAIPGSEPFADRALDIFSC